MRWRNIGPQRGGRTKSAAGVASQPNVFYIGVCNGGVWKTTDYGRTWNPIFDDQPTGSIGAVAVAPSDPNIIYVGSGEGLQRPDLSVGDGVYKSTDAGKTWTHLGLRDGQQIPQIAVDPRNPDRLFVAVLGHPVRPERGARPVSLDRRRHRLSRRSSARTRTPAPRTSQIDPSNPDDRLRRAVGGAPGSLGERGVDRPGRRHLQIDRRRHAPGSPSSTASPTASSRRTSRSRRATPKRLYASVAAGGGVAHLPLRRCRRALGARDRRHASGGPHRRRRPLRPGRRPEESRHRLRRQHGRVEVRSTAARPGPASAARPAATITSASGSTRTTREIILLASDQGAIITVNGGETWSSWYNQPTAQMYHVNADNAFPYSVCSGQQESGSACVASRGNDGQITFREWHPVGVEEYGYAVPDPLDPEHRLRRQDHALRPAHRAGRRTSRRSRSGPPTCARCAPRRWCSRRPTRTCCSSRPTRCGKPPTAATAGQQISPDLTRKTWEQSGQHRQVSRPADRRAVADAASSTRSRRRRSTSIASGPAPTTA